MKRFGLLGGNVEHSFSPELHACFSPEPYRLFSLPEPEARAFLEAADFDGLNVTIPYKQTVLTYLSALTPRAKDAGSVNTVVRRKDGTLLGDNTDCAGLAALLDRAAPDLSGRKVLVLGTGGTAHTARAVLEGRGACPVFISRRGEENYDTLERHQDAVGLINTTPVGMAPDAAVSPVDLRRLPGLRFVADVIYNPLRTALLQQAEVLGIPHIGGLRMLVEQAAESRALFDGAAPSPESTEAAYRTLLKQKINVVLTGMPGCGKSTVGCLLARRLGLPFIDTDERIEARGGMPIPKYFAREGESAFRALEKQVIAEVTARGGQVIAVGGGAPMDRENRFRLRMNGLVLLLERPLDLLAAEGRPLSAGGLPRLEELRRERGPLYAACSDITLRNDAAPEDCVRAAEEAYHEAVDLERTEHQFSGHPGA